MRPASAPWLRGLDVPEDWRPAQVKHLVRFTSGEPISAEAIEPQGRYAVYGANGLRGYTDRTTHSGMRVLVGRVGALCGNAHIADGKYWVSENALVGQVQAELEVRWLRYMLQAMNLGQYSQATAQPLVTAGRIESLGVDVPQMEEQRAIASYLDRETARIDTLIEEQQRLIEILRERREATIRSALLCGLDDVKTAPSGVELLGAVPKHWRMVPTRYLCTITTGSEDSGNATDAGEYPFYVRGREVLRIDRYSFEGKAVMTPGDGQGGTGKVFHYFDGKFEAHQRVYVFTDFKGVTGWYFYYFLSTFLRPVALAGSNTVTMESLRRPLLADFKVAVPPINEQQRITAYLDDQTAKIDTLVAEAECFVDLVRERRAALITAAVTGQIDVGEMA
ncbi:restriction endonuclease subunit S [Micromonospora zamorensis]|uniref:restriction endonuclease subunit S n=1 Tax=Micromonospora zamorensis TaxID=709883 RepID=UPI002E16E4CD